MQSVCSECGRTIENEFLFCPWCGINHFKRETRILEEDGEGIRWTPLQGHKVTDISSELRELSCAGGWGALTGQFRRVEQHKRIAHITRTLDALERDLEALVLSEEMHK